MYILNNADKSMLILTAALLLLMILVAFAIAGPMGAPWVPAFKEDVEKVLDDSGLKAGQLYVELGCGDGRLLKAAAKRGATAVGYEINPLMWLAAWLRNLGEPKVRVILGDFWQKDLTKADIVMTFLTPRYMQKLEDKLKKELRPGTVFVSYIFELPNKKPALKRHHWQVYHY